MKTQSRVLCPACNKETVVARKTDKNRGGIEHTYFRCRKCGHKVTICYTDEKGRRGMKEQQRIYAAGDSVATQAGAAKLQVMMDELRERLGKTG